MSLTIKERKRIRDKKYYNKNKEKIKERRKSYYNKNKEKCRGYSKKYYDNNPNKRDRKEYHKKYALQTIFKAFETYGGKCEWCGIDNPLLLGFHHRIKGDRKIRKETTISLTQRIQKNSKLDDVLLLCANCHRFADVIDKTTNRGVRFLRIHKDHPKYEYWLYQVERRRKVYFFNKN